MRKVFSLLILCFNFHINCFYNHLDPQVHQYLIEYPEVKQLYDELLSENNSEEIYHREWNSKESFVEELNKTNSEGALFELRFYPDKLFKLLQFHERLNDFKNKAPSCNQRNGVKKLQGYLPNKIVLISSPLMQKMLANFMGKLLCEHVYFLSVSSFKQHFQSGIDNFNDLINSINFQKETICLIVEGIDRLSVLETPVFKLFCEFLENKNLNNHIWIIGLATNYNLILPSLQKHFCVFQQNKPDSKMRVNLMQAHFDQWSLTNEQEQWFIEKTEGFSLSDIFYLIVRLQFIKKDWLQEPIEITHQDLDEALAYFIKSVRLEI